MPHPSSTFRPTPTSTSRPFSFSVGRWVLFLLAALVLSGCGKTPLFSDVTESEANEMMAALLQINIPCEKIAGKEGKWALSVRSEDFMRAMEKLKSLGLPRDKFQSIGDMFQKTGLVSSPTEERVRFVYGLSQELSETLMKIDGVLSARVHIVLPNNDPLSDTAKPSAAAVFIKHRPGFNVESTTPDLKNLVARSIEGLTFENVTVVLTAAAETADIVPVLQPAKSPLETWAIPAAAAVGGFTLGSTLLLFRRREKRSQE